MLKKYIILLTIVTIFNLTLWGCAGKKITSCNSIKEVATELNDKVQIYLTSEEMNQIKTVAQQFQQAQEKILSSAVKDKYLSDSADKLADIYQKYSQITNDYITAYQNKNSEQIAKYKQEINQLFVQQEQLIQQVNNYCLQD